MIVIRGIDHIVLSVADVDRALAFYGGLLGLQVEREAEFRAGQVGFPSVRLDDRFVIDLFPRATPEETPTLVGANGGTATAGNGPALPVPTPNLDHFCLVTDMEELGPVIAQLEQHQVPILRGPVPRWGAQGMAMSVYVRDPDGNELEIRTYSARGRAEAEQAQPAAATQSTSQ